MRSLSSFPRGAIVHGRIHRDGRGRLSCFVSALAVVVAVVAFVAVAVACEEPHFHDDHVDEGPFAVEVVSFDPGEGAGFGQDRMPDVVLGPPVAAESTASGSTDVLSLGVGGVIVLRLGHEIVDEEGIDFIVFENPFLVAGGPAINSEAGEVSVSVDGEEFTPFPCDPESEDVEAANGCAGFGVVLDDQDPQSAQTAGGDQFDLADVGLASALFVRIEDQATGGAGGNSAGFDLDAVASTR